MAARRYAGGQVLACAERLEDGAWSGNGRAPTGKSAGWSLISPGSAELLRQGDERGRQGDYPQAIALAERACWSGANGGEHERVLADQISTSLILLGRGVEARARFARTPLPDHPSGRLAFHQCKAWIHAALGDRDEVKAEMAASIHAFHQAEEERAWPDGPYGDPADAFAVDPVFSATAASHGSGPCAAGHGRTGRSSGGGRSCGVEED